MTEQTNPASSKRKLLVGGGVAVAAIAAIAVFFVLPAEFGIDPTGVGKKLGLTEIADPVNEEFERGSKRTGVLTLSETAPAPEPGATDQWTIELAPYESIEFKYVMDEGKAFTFFWKATGKLHYDMHSHPFEGGTALTESYAISDADHQGGRYVAPFTGIHGWFWENRSLETVKLTLDVSGGMTSSKLFSKAGEVDRELSAPAAAE